MTKELKSLEEGPKAEIHIDLLKTTVKATKLKRPGQDGIHGLRFKKFTSIHNILALEMNTCLQRAHIPEWMTKGKTTLIQKGLLKGAAQKTCRLLTCPPMMHKILTAQIREDIYNSITSHKRMPQWIQRHRCVTLNRSAHLQREKDHTEKLRYPLD